MPDQFNIVFQPSGLRGTIEENSTILDAARQLGVALESVCGGKGNCGKCKVRIEEGNYAKYKINSSIEAVTTGKKLTRSSFQNSR